MSSTPSAARRALGALPGVLLALAVGWLLRGACHSTPPADEALAEAAEAEPEVAPTVWTCSMHPQVRDDRPGKCPICFMDLVPVEAEAGLEQAELTLPPLDRARMRIETAPVVRREAEVSVRMSGKLAIDETRLSTITAWVGGRLDRLFVDSTGVDVMEGDHLVEIYSPELYATEAELLQVLDLGADDALAGGLIGPARERLRQFGLSPEQIAEVEARGTATDTYTMYAPEGGVVIHRGAGEGQWVERGTPIYTIADLAHLWVLLDAYERDLSWLRYGQDVTFETEAFPGELFHGTIAFLSPELDERTRTVTVRVNVENHDRRLRPGMFVRAVVHADVGDRGRVLDPALAGKWVCTMHPEVIVEEPEDCPVCGMELVAAESRGLVPEPQDTGPPPLLVPASAALLTGRRAVVYVEEERTPGVLTYSGREVLLGPRVGPWFVVLAGLEEGERVVIEGAFKLDAELQIRAQPSMMSAADGGPGDADARGGAAADPAAVPVPHVHLPALRAALVPVWAAYSELAAALADDDPDAARAAASNLARAATAIDPAEFPEAMALAGLLGTEELVSQHDEHDEPGEPEGIPTNGLAAWGLAIASIEELEVMRERFASASEEMTELVRRYGIEGATVRRMECPMALDGEAGHWLQADATIANPYMGEAMLRCGSELELLQSGDDR